MLFIFQYSVEHRYIGRILKQNPTFAGSSESQLVGYDCVNAAHECDRPLFDFEGDIKQLESLSATFYLHL